MNLRFAILFCLTVAGISPAMGSPAAPSPEIGSIIHEDRYPSPSVSFPGGVTGIPALTYRPLIGYRSLKLDLYLPPQTMTKPKQGFPLVIYIHGGGWLQGDRHGGGVFLNFPEVLASLAARGYVVAAVDYRLSGEARFPAQIHDIKAAIRWLRARAKLYSIDPARAMAWGGSAGGHLAALAAVSCGVKALEPTTPTLADPSNEQFDCLQGSVAWFGVFNFASIAEQARRQAGALSRDGTHAAEWLLLGCAPPNCSQTQIAAASPVTYVDAKDPPMLLITGDQDKLVPYQQTLEMAERLKTAGVKSQTIVIPGVNHVFIGDNLEQTRQANLHALAATFEFFDRTIGR